MPSPRLAEARVLELALGFASQSVLAITQGRGIAAWGLADSRPTVNVVCWFRDQYRARQLEDAGPPPNLRVACAADPPEQEFDLALLPFSMQGEAELTRETLQEAAFRLIRGATLLAGTDNPRDTWLRDQVEEVLGKCRPHHFGDAVVYEATRQGSIRRRRDFSCEFVYRDRDRLLQARSRPGVFSHRHVDPGARQLLANVEIEPGQRVLDLGCGAGTVAIALAAREPTAQVHAVDSDTRAVECTRRGAELNGLTNVSVELNAFGGYRDAGSYDLVLTNPPYYADQRIAGHLLGASYESLRPGGRVVVVTKNAAWYEESLPTAGWERVQVTPSKAYHIVTARKPHSTNRIIL